MRLRKIKNASKIIQKYSNYIFERDLELVLLRKIWNKIILEVGCGTDYSLQLCAVNNCENLYIAIDIDDSVLLKSIRKINTPLDNLYYGKINILKLSSDLLINKIEEIIIRFPDPWPKKRHYKRSVYKNTAIRKYLLMIKNNGNIIIKTDNIIVVKRLEFALKMISGVDISYEFKNKKDYKDVTFISNYEKKFLNKNNTIHIFKIIKINLLESRI